MIRFIVCNLDLLKTEDGISSGLMARIPKLRDKGILFSVAGKGNYAKIRPLFRNMISDMLFICDNGAVAFYDDEPVYKYYHERRVVSDIVREAVKTFSCNIVINGEKTSYILDGNKGFEYFLENDEGIKPTVVSELYKIREEIVSVKLYKYSGFNEDAYNEFASKWGRQVILLHNGEWVEIIPPGVDKGLAISTIQKLYDISPEDTMTFGVDYSDVKMFENSYFSYAMQQADAEIRNSAKHIAVDIESIVDDILLM